MTQPPIFRHAIEPMDADDWLQTIESKLEIAPCEGRDRVLYAAHTSIENFMVAVKKS